MDNERETKPASPPETKPAKPDEKKELRKPSFMRDAPEQKAKSNGDNGPPAPDFDAAAKLIREDISSISTRSSKLNGDKSASWKRVQDEFHVHKGAAKDAAKLANMSEELQSEYLRSFFGLMKPLGIGIRRDLVDLAEGVEGLTIPIKDAPESELDDGASVATKAMRETAASDKAKG